jgi:hypothetical protein
MGPNAFKHLLFKHFLIEVREIVEARGSTKIEFVSKYIEQEHSNE